VPESRAADKATTTAAPVGRKGKGKAKAAAASGCWDSTTHLLVALETMCKVLKLKLIRVLQHRRGIRVSVYSQSPFTSCLKASSG